MEHERCEGTSQKPKRNSVALSSLAFDASVARLARVLTDWSRRGLPFYSSGARHPSRPLASTASKTDTGVTSLTVTSEQ